MINQNCWKFLEILTKSSLIGSQFFITFNYSEIQLTANRIASADNTFNNKHNNS
jgi:hypothetical protein